MVEAYGGRCACCGDANIEFLCIDHKGNWGHSDEKNSRGGKGLYLRLKRLNYPKDRYRLLCHNCNFSIGIYGYCPHHPEERCETARSISMRSKGVAT